MILLKPLKDMSGVESQVVSQVIVMEVIITLIRANLYALI